MVTRSRSRRATPLITSAYRSLLTKGEGPANRPRWATSWPDGVCSTRIAFGSADPFAFPFTVSLPWFAAPVRFAAAVFPLAGAALPGIAPLTSNEQPSVVVKVQGDRTQVHDRVHN